MPGFLLCFFYSPPVIPPVTEVFEVIGKNERTLLRLLRAALNEERLSATDLSEPSNPAEPPETPDWDAILQEAGAQTVLGLIAEAVPDEVAAAARSEALRLKAKFMRILHGQTELVSLFRGAGIPLVILKGMAAAVYYPKPHTRAMGDVDFLVPQERFSDAMRLMEENGYLPLESHADTPAERPGDRQPDWASNSAGPEDRQPPAPPAEAPRHVQYAKGGVEYELHHHFSSFGLDLEPILLQGFERTVTRAIAGREFPTLPNPENALVLLAHIRQHLLESGLGLRQVIDWLQCLKSLSAEETARLQLLARQTGLYTLACTVNRICDHHLGSSFCWDAAVEPETEEALLEHLFERGNFGRKLGADRPVEAVSLSIREQGLFPYLQRMGLLHWEAARRYALLRPFAWLHTVFRYAGKGTRLLARSPAQVRSQVSDGMKINTLLHRLGLD